jgi:Na+/H+ antiporter NhaA
MSGVELLSVQTLIMAFVGTSLMTIFSYAIGIIRKKKFSEPALLNELISRLKQKSLGALVPIAGWFLHYLIGLLFIISYHLYWRESDSHPTIINCIILGALSGVIGICGWKLAFRIHPHPPNIDFKEFYSQLFFAHVVFGVGAFMAANWF